MYKNRTVYSLLQLISNLVQTQFVFDKSTEIATKYNNKTQNNTNLCLPLRFTYCVHKIMKIYKNKDKIAGNQSNISHMSYDTNYVKISYIK